MKDFSGNTRIGGEAVREKEHKTKGDNNCIICTWQCHTTIHKV